MPRVHGNEVITRRKEIKKYKDYHRYRPYLIKDFKKMCGYCGKNSNIIKEQFEIDHFVPMNFDKSKELCYTNLVFSCKKCNRAKSDEWPTKDSNLYNDGNVGFVDPASDEFDNHMQRDANGDIYGITNVGQYMCTLLHFDIRPIGSVWKAMELSKKSDLLSKKIENDKSLDNLKDYFEVNEMLKNILAFLLDEGVK